MKNATRQLFTMRLMQEKNAMRGEVGQLSQQLQTVFKTLDEINATSTKEFKGISSALIELRTNCFIPSALINKPQEYL